MKTIGIDERVFDNFLRYMVVSSENRVLRSLGCKICFSHTFASRGIVKLSGKSVVSLFLRQYFTKDTRQARRFIKDFFESPFPFP